MYLGTCLAESLWCSPETTTTLLIGYTPILIGKDPDDGKDWRQKKGTAEDEMPGWHHWLHGHEFEEALGDGDGQGSLVFCNPWDRKELDTTESLNWTDTPMQNKKFEKNIYN